MLNILSSSACLYFIDLISFSSFFTVNTTTTKISKITDMSILSPNPPHILYREIHHQHQHQLWSSVSGSLLPKSNGSGFDRSKNEWKGRAKRDLRAYAFWPELFKPAALEMEAIQDSQQFDEILEQAKQLSQPILVDWFTLRPFALLFTSFRPKSCRFIRE